MQLLELNSELLHLYDKHFEVAMGVMFDAIRRANVAVDSGDTNLAAAISSAVREMCLAVGLQLNVADVVDIILTSFSS